MVECCAVSYKSVDVLTNSIVYAIESDDVKFFHAQAREGDGKINRISKLSLYDYYDPALFAALRGSLNVLKYFLDSPEWGIRRFVGNYKGDKSEADRLIHLYQISFKNKTKRSADSAGYYSILSGEDDTVTGYLAKKLEDLGIDPETVKPKPKTGIATMAYSAFTKLLS